MATRQQFATNGSLAASVFERVEFSSDSTCEGDGGEFNSPRRGEETRGRQLEARGDNSCEQYTAVRTRHTRKHFRVWFKRSSRFAARTVLCHFARVVTPHKLISCRTRNVHGFTAFLFHFRTALHLRFVLLKGVSVTIRNMAFSLAVLPNTAP